MNKPLDDRGGPVPGRGADTLEPAEAPVTGTPTVHERRTVGVDMVTSPDDLARVPTTVMLDGNKTLEGPQRSEALALLGISEEALDGAWYRFAGEVNAGNQTPYMGDPEWGLPSQHQPGMGWQVEVQIDHGSRQTLEGLANIDLRTAKRTVTFWAMRWNTDTYPPVPDGVVEKEMSLEDAGALGASWRKVDEGEMKATEDARDALLDARHELGWALEEIQVAIKVADAAWKGPRSEATKFKFGLEYEIIAAASKSIDEWLQFLDGLIKDQREAKEANDALNRELIVAAVFFAVPVGLLMRLTFSAARAAKAALGGEKVVSYAQRIDRILGPLRSRYGRVVDRIEESTVALHSTMILARGASGLATDAAVNKAGGRPTTAWDWLKAFGLAGVSYGAGRFLQWIGRKHEVDFPPPVLTGTEGAAQHGYKLFTNDAFAVPFAMGFPADAKKRGVAAQLRRAEADMLRGDPKSPPMRRAYDRWNADRSRAHPEGRLSSPGLDSLQPLGKYIDEEIDLALNAFDRKVEPMLEFTFGVATQAAEKLQDATTRPPPPIDDVPGTPSGTVPQFVGVGLRAAPLAGE